MPPLAAGYMVQHVWKWWAYRLQLSTIEIQLIITRKTTLTPSEHILFVFHYKTILLPEKKYKGNLHPCCVFWFRTLCLIPHINHHWFETMQKLVIDLFADDSFLFAIFCPNHCTFADLYCSLLLLSPQAKLMYL